MRLLLLFRKHAGINRIANNFMTKSESSRIDGYGFYEVCGRKADHAFACIDASIFYELDCFEIRYCKSRPHCTRDLKNELLVAQKSIGSIQHSDASGLWQYNRIILLECFKPRHYPRPRLWSTLFDHLADFANEERISTGALPNRLVQPNGDGSVLKRGID